MKYIQNKVEETVLLTPNEFEIFRMMLDNCMYFNDKKKIDMVVEEVGAEAGEDGKEVKHWQVVNVFDKEKHYVLVDIDIQEVHDNQMKVHTNCASVEFDEKTGRAIQDEWSELVRKVIGRCIQYATAKESAKSIVPSGLTPLASADILGKSYFVYMEVIRVKDEKGKPHEMPGAQFMKLVSSVDKIDDKIINQIRPFAATPNWVSYGRRPNVKETNENERATTVFSLDTLCKDYGIKKTDNAALWDLIEKHKIHPVWMCAPTLEACVQQSAIITENILAENRINPKFTKSNIIV